MDAGQVRTNLARRNKLEQSGIDRLIKGAVAGGYSREQIEAFTGRGITPETAPAPSTPERIRFDAQGNRVR